MLKVGITGGIGSGKSTVTNMLKDDGYSIIDADIVAREVFTIYPEIMDKIKHEFGYDFFDSEGKLKRKEFGNYIFKNDDKRIKLESIMIPFITREIHHRIKMCEENNCKLCFLDAPTLIENNLHTAMDVIILVWVSSDVQIQRVRLRDDLSLDETMDRIKSQMPLDDKRKFSNFIIDNGKSIGDTKLQLDLIIAKLERSDVEL